jgi:hypothetical protein
VACVLHFDEVNMLSPRAFDMLVTELGVYMHDSDPNSLSAACRFKFPLLSIITGTSSLCEGPIKLSRFGTRSLPAPTLSEQGSCEVVGKPIPTLSRLAWFSNARFKRLLASALGVPRLLVYVYLRYLYDFNPVQLYSSSLTR